MKISQINSIQAPITVKRLASYNRLGAQRDVFIKSTDQDVSFKGAEQNISELLLKNDKLTKLIMTLGLEIAGITTLMAATSIKKEMASETTEADGNFLSNILKGLFGEKTDGDGNFLANMLRGVFAEKANDSETQNYKEEYEKLKTKYELLRAKVGEPSQAEEEESISAEDFNEAPEIQKSKLVFPKKKGRLSNNQLELKAIAESLDLSDSTLPKMTMICEELMRKNSHKIGAAIKDNNDIAADLVKELNDNISDKDAVEKIIDAYMKKCELAAPEGKIVTYSYAPQLRGQKVIGKIDLPEKKELITRDKDGNITSIFFKKAGTVPKYSAEQLDEIFKYFVRTLYNDYKDREKQNPGLEKPKWIYNFPTPKRIRKTDIVKEVKEEMESGTPDDQYKYIVKEDYREIADVINEDPRYHDLFGTHSALRLLDRYVVFSSESEGIDKQSKKILDKLFELVENAYKEGLRVDVYRDKKGYIGLSLTLSAEKFDKEALDIFGSTDIILGLSERQEGKIYKGVENHKKEAIITTIYPKDV